MHALAYYFDHREVIDQSLEVSPEFVNSLRQQSSSKLHDYPQPEGDARLSEEADHRERLTELPKSRKFATWSSEASLAAFAALKIRWRLHVKRPATPVNKTRRVHLRVTERDFNLAHARAREEGIPYQTLLSSVMHKDLSGRLTERSLNVSMEASIRLPDPG